MNVGSGVISVVLVDDHTLFREGLAELIESDTTFHIVAQGSNGADALVLVTEHRPDVLLVDVEMPGPDTQEIVSRLRREHPDTQIIVLSMHDKPSLVQGMLERGAAAYLVKTIARQELIAAMRSVVTSQGDILLAVPRHTVDKPLPDRPLTARELEVLQLTALAMSNAQIGKRLQISEGTVKRHLTTVYAKLHAVSRIDAIRKATTARLIPGITPEQLPNSATWS